MLKDRGSFIFDYQRNKKAAFTKEVFNGFVTVIALNRAAKRLLNSNKIKKMADRKGAIIDINSDFSCIY